MKPTIFFEFKPIWRQVAVVSALLAALCLPLELGSEIVTFSTTYPSPVGIYARIITTGGGTCGGGPCHTVLARDNGNVGIGTNVPQAKLDVNGGIRPGSNGIAIGAACASEGTLAYDITTTHAPVYCNNTLKWAAMGGTNSPACNSPTPELATNKPCFEPLYRCPSNNCPQGQCAGPWADYGCNGQIDINSWCTVIVYPYSETDPCTQIGTYLLK